MGLLGKLVKFLLGPCFKPTTAGGDSESVGPYGVSAATVGVSAFAHDLFNFEITSQVPEGLSQHVVSSKKVQANWYRKLVEAWREAQPPPRTAEEAARLVIQTLNRQRKADVEGLLAFYGLPLPHTPVQVPAEVPTSLPQGVQFEFQTLPVDARAVADGDGLTVYVSTADPTESSRVPSEVLMAAVRRAKARAKKNYTKANELHKKITDAGYRVLNIQNEEILARKCRIRLRGIDAPENEMPYGQEAKQELVRLLEGKCLRVLVYGEDQFHRTVADLYCNGIFVQEQLLKKGAAWHYEAYDKRPEFASWEKEARQRRVGLWASSNPEKPWEWTKMLCLCAGIVTPPPPAKLTNTNTGSKLSLSCSLDKASSVRLQSFKCKALGESSQPQTSLAETVYPGIYGPWTVDSTDVREVILYRSGLVTAAASFVVAASAAFLPDSFFLTGIVKHNLDFVYAIGAGGLGLSLFLIHIYVTEIKRTLQAFWGLGVVGSVAAYASLALPAGEGLVQYVVDNPIAIWFVGPLFVSLTGLVFKEGLCYGKLEAGILTFIIPITLLGHLSGLMDDGTKLSLLGFWMALFVIFSGRKFTQPIKDDIGDKSVFTFNSLPEDEKQAVIEKLEQEKFSQNFD